MNTRLEILKLLHSPQVSLYTPLGLGTGLGVGLGLVAARLGMGDPVLVGSALGSCITAALKVQQIFEVNRIETFLLEGLVHEPEKQPYTPSPLVRSYALVSPRVHEKHDTLIPKPAQAQSALPLRVWLKSKNTQTPVIFPDWFTLDNLKFFVQQVIRERKPINDKNLCGKKYGPGAFTISRTEAGTLTLFREWLFAQGWAEANVPGEWEEVYRQGWKLNRGGRQSLQVCLSHLTPSPPQ